MTTQTATRYEQTDYEADAQVWSDLHKDVYGSRPRGPIPTFEQMEGEMTRLQKMLDVELDYERRRAIDAQFRFEKWIRRLQLDGTTRRDAIITIARVEDCYVPAGSNEDGSQYAAFIDAGFLCYKLGLAYSLEAQIEAEFKGVLA